MNKVQLYFNRIGLDSDIGNLTLDYELLKQIQYAHVTHIPYENLDILDNIPLNLDNEALFEKIIVNQRGGYCFEINSLYNWLLREIGFNTTSYMARYLRGENDIPMRRHRVIIVELEDKRIMCDAGIGDRAPRYPLILEERLIQAQFGETYKFVKDEFYGWLILDYHKGEWGSFFAFTEEVQVDKDYVMPSFFCEKHPDSPFNTKNIIAIKTADGRKTISDMAFRIFSGDNVSETEITDGAMLLRILIEHFGINTKRR